MKHLKNQYKINIVLITVFTLFAIISCGPAKNDSKQSPQLPAQQPIQVQNNTVSKEMTTDTEDVTNAADTATDSQGQPGAEKNDSEVVINPPHGQPGHRCDIPVGSPLNATASAAAPQATNTPVNNSLAPTIENARRLNGSQGQRNTSTSSGNGTRINPPHGQPGHRCDVPVGSPLP